MTRIEPAAFCVFCGCVWDSGKYAWALPFADDPDRTDKRLLPVCNACRATSTEDELGEQFVAACVAVMKRQNGGTA